MLHFLLGLTRAYKTYISMQKTSKIFRTMRKPKWMFKLSQNAAKCQKIIKVTKFYFKNVDSVEYIVL